MNQPDEVAAERDETVDEREASLRRDLRLAAAQLASGVWAGFLSGLVIGGIGGRLAMFLLRVTSDPSLVGRETDDGFVIGQFTGSTMFLVLLAGIVGILGGIIYLVVRLWLPERGRPWLMAALSAAVGGAVIVRPDGIDFTLLEPLWLAIALFVLIPALYAVAMVFLAEWFLRSATARATRGWLLLILPLIPLLIAGPLGVLMVLVMFGLWAGLWLLNQKVPVANWWTSAPATWVGRVALAALFVYAGVGLVQDSIEILS